MAIFHPNCTLPTQPGLVGSPNVRGTTEIILACVSILILTTWSVHFSALPLQVRNQTFGQKLLLQLFSASEKALMTIMMIIVPEITVTRAVTELLCVKRWTKYFKRFAVDDYAQSGNVWTETHTFFADMGGFQICFPVVEPAVYDHPEISDGLSTMSDLTEWHSSTPTDLEPEQSLSGRVADCLGQASPYSPNSIHGHLLAEQDFELDCMRRDTFEHPHLSIPTSPADSHQLPLDLPTSSDTPRLKRRIGKSQDPTGRTDLKMMKMHLTSDEDQAQKLSSRFGFIGWKPVHRELVLQVAAGYPNFPLSLPWNRQPRVTMCYSRLLAFQADVWTVDAAQLFFAREIGLIKELPQTTYEDLADKNKGDALVRVLALIQVLWLLIQVASRAFSTPRHLVSQLEITTLSIALCMVAVYFLLWNKPQSASATLRLQAVRHPTAEELWYFTRLCTDSAPRRQATCTLYWVIRNGFSSMIRPGELWCISSVIGVLFGLSHFAATNLHFPTFIEGRLWWYSCLSVTLGPAATLVAGICQVMLVEKTKNWPEVSPPSKVFTAESIWHQTNVRNGLILHKRYKLSFYINSTIGALATTAYVFVRTFMLVEQIRCLFYLPPGAFVATWTSSSNSPI